VLAEQVLYHLSYAPSPWTDYFSLKYRNKNKIQTGKGREGGEKSRNRERRFFTIKTL
jgi:hypothetical protein